MSKVILQYYVVVRLVRGVSRHGVLEKHSYDLLYTEKKGTLTETD